MRRIPPLPDDKGARGSARVPWTPLPVIYAARTSEVGNNYGATKMQVKAYIVREARDTRTRTVMPTAKQLLRFLRKQGYVQERQAGSHLILEHPSRRMLVVPVHKGDLPRGLFLRILKDAGFSEKDFLNE